LQPDHYICFMNDSIRAFLARQEVNVMGIEGGMAVKDKAYPVGTLRNALHTDKKFPPKWLPLLKSVVVELYEEGQNIEW